MSQADTEQTLCETARAKVNLSLTVHGRLPDGYHHLESLVVFPDIHDRLTLEPGRPLALDIDGPMARHIPAAGNLVTKAAEAVRSVAPSVRLGRFHLEKHLPAAAGIGGGSADAAAALRLIIRANTDLSDLVDWRGIASRIGADVPVCLQSRASVMSGIGEVVRVLPRLPPAWILLVNPGVAVATADVFRALSAAAVETLPRPAPAPDLPSFAALVDWLAARPNDLQPAACALCSAIPGVLAALETIEGARIVRMSGSGATCFALFDNEEACAAGAVSIRAREAGWWVAAAPIG